MTKFFVRVAIKKDGLNYYRAIGCELPSGRKILIDFKLEDCARVLGISIDEMLDYSIGDYPIQ